MAKSTIGPRIGIDGEAEYRKSIENIIQQAKTLDSEMRKVASSFDDNADAQEKNQKTTEILTKQVENQRKRVQELAAMLERAQNELGESNTKTLKWEQALNDATAELNQMERQLRDTATYTHQASEAMEKGAKGTFSFADALKANLLSDVIMSGLRELANLAKQAAGYIMDAGMNFESMMSRVEAISGASAEEMALLEAKAKEMGKTTVFSASESAAALQYMAMAGWKTQDMLDGLPGIMNLAAASGEDLAATSDIVTDALTAFGLSAADSEHFADILAKASSSANTNVALMGETFKYVAPVAGALNYSVEDMAVAIGLMANSGIKASQAGTSLRGTLTNLAKPSAKVAAYINELGLSLTDASGEMLPFGELMLDMRDAFRDLTEAEKAEYAAGIAGKEAMSGLLAIVNSSDADFAKLTAEIANASGTAQEMAHTMTDNLAGSMTLMKSAAEGMGIALYEQVSRPAKEAVDMLTQLFSGDIGIADFARGIADVLSTSAPTLIQTGHEFVKKLLQGMIESAPAVMQAIVPLASQLVQGFLDNLPLWLELGVTLLRELIRGLGTAAPDLIDAIMSAVLDIIDFVTAPDTLTSLVSAGIELLLALVDGLLAAQDDLIAVLPDIINAVVTALLANLELLVTAGIELAVAVAVGMISAIPQMLAMLPEIFKHIADALINMDWKSLGINIVQGIISGLKSMLTALRDAAVNIGNSIMSSVKGVLDINSPSGAMEKEVGRMIPPGITLGVDKAMPAALRDMRAQFKQLPSVTLPQQALAATHYGGVTLNVYATQGQDVNAIADAVMHKLHSAVARKEAVYR